MSHLGRKQARLTRREDRQRHWEQLPLRMAGLSLYKVFQPKVLMIIGIHWVVLISLIFINKQLVSAQHGDLTVFIAWSQCLFSILAICIVMSVKRCCNPDAGYLNIPLAAFFQSDVLAMTFSFITVIIMNNLLLKHINVAFYQVARSSTLIFTIVFSRCFLGNPVTMPIIGSCVLIISGFVISVDQEMIVSSLSVTGVSYGVLASMAAALGGIFTKRAVRFVEGDALGIALTNNANSLVFLLPLLLSTGQLQLVLSSSEFLDAGTWVRLMTTGVLSLLAGWASIKVISLTSPLTHHMSINAKSMLQTFIAVMIEGEPKTMTWWLGNCLVILGIVNYGFSRDTSSACSYREVTYISENSSAEAQVNLKQKNLLNA